MAERILPEARTTGSTPPEASHKRLWLTTLDVAKRLGVSTRWVRWLARHGELPCELTEAGQRIFRRADVQRIQLQRTDRQVRPRALVLRAVRVRMLTAAIAPQQPRLRLVRAGGERALPQAEVKRAGSGANRGESDTCPYVNRKSAGGRR